MIDKNNKPFLEIEDELNIALKNIGVNKENMFNESIEEKISALKVQELLEDLKTDEFEKVYIITAAKSNAFNNDSIKDDEVSNIRSLAEYKLSQMDKNSEIELNEKNKLQNMSNYYLIPHSVNQTISMGTKDEVKKMDIYTINDNEGYSLYTIIDKNNVSITSGFKKRIENYLNENYKEEIKNGKLKIDSIIEAFTPKDINTIYNMLGNEYAVTARFMPDRIDELLKLKGIIKEDNIKEIDGKIPKGQDNLIEENKVDLKDDLDLPKDKDNENNNIIPKDENELSFEKEIPEHKEGYVEKIARLNHVKPVVVNTRIIENFEKVEEDTGIQLKGRYQKGDVVAVRIPYKLGYRTFLAEKNTGLTIDSRGTLDRRGGKFYNFNEMEDYFRYKLVDGQDGGENGIPLKDDEERDYTTYLDINGSIKEKKFINNGNKQDMLRNERQRYLLEVKKADEKLREAIERYQKDSTQDNYHKVREIIKEKVDIDNKYNALDEQRKITKETKENTEKVIQRDLDDEDDEWFPGMGRFH